MASESGAGMVNEVSASPHLPFKSVESRFTQKSGYIYDSMKQRFSERKSEKTQRVTQIGREIPFSKDEFRQWLIRQLGGEGGVIKCRYCSLHMGIDEVVVDHRVSVAHGGSLGLENLDLICAEDNKRKGKMCGDCYERLLDWTAVAGPRIGGLHPQCRADMLQRMQVAVSLGAWQRREIARNAKKQKVVTVTQEEQF